MGYQQNSKSNGASIFERAGALLDNFVSPQVRQQWYRQASAFAHDSPYQAAFLFIQLLLCSTPLFIFIAFLISTVLFSATLAVLFTLFWAGVALFFLVPSLVIAFSFGLGVWVWAVSSFLVARWIYSCVPVTVKSHTEVRMSSGKTAVINKSGKGLADVKADVVPKTPEGKETNVWNP